MKKTIRNRLCGIVTGAAAAVPAGMLTVFAEGETSTASTGNSLGAMISTLALPVLLIVFLYFVMFRPQQKQEKETEKMQRELQIGDEVVTIGGIVGFVLRIEEPTETVVLETGSDRLKIRLKRKAIAENITLNEQKEAEKAERNKRRANPLSAGKPKDE